MSGEKQTYVLNGLIIHCFSLNLSLNTSVYDVLEVTVSHMLLHTEANRYITRLQSLKINQTELAVHRSQILYKHYLA